jgi:molybdopterin-guanine dinucleotide biosynthesis protein A
MNYPIDNITGIILAGGRATRMGGQDKGLIRFEDKPLIEHVITALRPQVGFLLISANRNLAHYAQIGLCPVLTDTYGHYGGPLAGIITTLEHIHSDYALIVPCDSPRLNTQLGKRLYIDLIEKKAQISIAHDGLRAQTLFSLINKSILPKLKRLLASGERKMSSCYAQFTLATCDCSDIADTFLNINTPDEL